MENVEIRTFETQNGYGDVATRREFVDELLGIVAHDDGQGPYVDMYVEGASTPFDTVNVWVYGEKRRENEEMVEALVLDRFKGFREDEFEDEGEWDEDE
jgi:hypothetical protein